MNNCRTINIWLIFFCGVVLAGCQSTTGYYKGARAERETVVSLRTVAVTGEEQWQDLYATVDYRIDQQGGKLTIVGVLAFSAYPQLNLARVDDFKLKLFLLDDNRIVLDSLDLVRVLGGAVQQTVPFNAFIDVSTAVKSLSFGYEGTFMTERGGRDSVWSLPKKSY